MRLTDDEKVQLKAYIGDDPAALKNINMNTGIDSRTINKTVQRGWLELAKGVKLREFLNTIKSYTA